MKKKLVSILLSLSMCSTFAMPLTTVAAEEAPAEDVKVAETVVPNATKIESSSPGAFELTTSGSNISITFGETDTVGDFSYYAAKGEWTDGTKLKSGYTVVENALALEKQSDAKYITLNGNKIVADNVTKKDVPVILTVKAKRDIDSKVESSQLKLNVSVKQKDLSKVSASDIIAQYSKETDGKTYLTLDDFVKKYKGQSGFTAKVNNSEGKPMTMERTDFKKISAFVDLDGVTPVNDIVPGKTSFYIIDSTVGTSGVGKVTGGSIVTTAGIKVEGKGNYTGTFTITNQPVSLQPQRVNCGTITGMTITYGSIGNLYDGLTVDDYLSAGEKVDVVKNFKFEAAKSSKKYLKVDTKDASFTIKKIPDEEEDRELEVIMTNKKNKLCKGSVKFKVTPLPISAGAFKFGDTSFGEFKYNYDKLIGTKDVPKVYDNFDQFRDKFLGKGKDDVKTAKANGLSFNFVNGNTGKAYKMKPTKDFQIQAVVNGTKSNRTEKGKLKQKAYLNGAKVATSATITIEGIGNFCGTYTESALEVPLQIQTITAAGAEYNKVATVTFGSLDKVNIYDNISIDEAMKTDGTPDALANDTNKESVIAKLKVKADGASGLKIDKDGKVIVKKVMPSNNPNTGLVTVQTKKNNKSIDSYYEVKFTVAPLSATDARIKIKTDNVSGKEFGSLDVAKRAMSKLSVFSTIDGKDIKLKAGSGKDYTKLNVTQLNAKDGTDLNGTVQTGPALKFRISADLQGNYSGSVSTIVDCSAKK